MRAVTQGRLRDEFHPAGGQSGKLLILFCASISSGSPGPFSGNWRNRQTQLAQTQSGQPARVRISHSPWPPGPLQCRQSIPSIGITIGGYIVFKSFRFGPTAGGLLLGVVDDTKPVQLRRPPLPPRALCWEMVGGTPYCRELFRWAGKTENFFTGPRLPVRAAGSFWREAWGP